jgi:hydroxyacylglutathione hydrolase
MEIAEGLFVYPWQNPYENNCNTYVIRGERALLVDPGHSRYLDLLLEQMERDGIEIGEIDLVLTTHAHPDNFEGVEAFVERDVRMTMSAEEERYLLGNGRGFYEMMGRSLPAFRVDFHLREGDLHAVGEVFQVLETPGHSPGSLSLYWPKRKALFTGDAVFAGGVGRTDFPEGDDQALSKSLDKLASLEADLLLPGHGDGIEGAEAVRQNFEFLRNPARSFL